VHDPMSVVFSILRPWPQVSKRGPLLRRLDWPPEYRHRQWGPLNRRAARIRCFACEGVGKVPDPAPSWVHLPVGDPCPECEGRGFTPTPVGKRLYFNWHTWQFGGTSWYFPPLVTVWHVDPDVGGDDDSCRRAVRTRQLEAHRAGHYWRDKWLWWRFRHMHWECALRLRLVPIELVIAEDGKLLRVRRGG